MASEEINGAPDMLVRAIIRAIYDGDLVMGQRLVEAQVMARHSVSRSTVREAFRRLAAEGVVDIVLHKGATIRRPGQEEMIDLLRVTEALVGLNARLAAERMTDPDIRLAFAEETAAMLDAAPDSEGVDYARLRTRFHRALLRASGSVELARSLPKLQLHLIRAYTAIPRAAHVSSYRAIREAVLSGNGEAAEEAGRRHVVLLIDAVRAGA
ncbi:hypothetical protein CG51_02425 [Haematobacter missouriensis]|uniref:GntR family transcriptional regulator n=1 Tax=Haematobacter missouriensis TaxID=366616 RepID=A0A212AMQ5_9RHOB|nr:GntR family transcriptional regulator [Haematobacter missouriensis]KFI32409.1 hypothetical protein CG51_02425 [Haematobacter missouriensis]OWJ71092.1 GntR family transcriptional regulator [Haematobacter missouriensis]OWJ82794.1 GntR family transcriptional regulator [Haematobacter missouriensis]